MGGGVFAVAVEEVEGGEGEGSAEGGADARIWVSSVIRRFRRPGWGFTKIHRIQPTTAPPCVGLSWATFLEPLPRPRGVSWEVTGGVVGRILWGFAGAFYAQVAVGGV